MAEELNVSVFDEIRAAIRTECDEKGFAWPPESSEAVGAANLVLRLAACLLERERASRQAWAEEAMRLDMADEARHCSGSSACPADVHHEGCFYRVSAFCCGEPRPTVDAGEPDENVTTCGNCGEDMDADMLDRLRYSPLSSRPQCAVHPDGGDVR